MEIKKIPNNANISILDLSDSNLRKIPGEVFKLKNLRKLNLSGNQIKDIPKEIAALKNLEVLDISNNKISNFFAKLCELKKLHTLNLNNNQISTVPRQILKLQHLRRLFIAGNKLRSLPEEFSKLNKLTALSLSRNLFSEMPASLLELQNIKQLWICSLPLRDSRLAAMQFNFKKLQSIYAYNPLVETALLDSHYASLCRIRGNSVKQFQQLTEIKPPINSLEPLSGAKNPLENKIPINMSETPRTNIFISYSHQDKTWLNKVQTHLKVLRHQTDFEFDVWDDNKILAGDKWKEQIATALGKAKVAILIVSTDFLASDFIQSNELPELLESADKNGTKLISIIVRPCRFSKQFGINEIQAVNSPSEALTKLSEPEQEEILLKLTERIEQLI